MNPVPPFPDQLQAIRAGAENRSRPWSSWMRRPQSQDSDMLMILLLRDDIKTRNQDISIVRNILSQWVKKLR